MEEKRETSEKTEKTGKVEKPERPYKVIRLLSNRIYPTYQLHAVMANPKTNLRDGLRLAALVTMDWVRRRLGDHAPEALQMAPRPEQYRDAGDNCLFPMHIDNGYVIDIACEPAAGIWCLQITEPDLGSDPGNPEQVRQAVPGRVITTNVEYRIAGNSLECGFQTLISDPEGVSSPAEVYRLAIVKRLANLPDFGLKQVTVLTPHPTVLKTAEDLRQLVRLLKDDRNQMPTVVFTMVDPAAKSTATAGNAAPAVPGNPPVALLMQRPGGSEQSALDPMQQGRLSMAGTNGEIPLHLRALSRRRPVGQGNRTGLGDKKTGQSTAGEGRTGLLQPPYPAEDFARSGMGYCRVYLLELPVGKLNSAVGCKAVQGDIVILPPPGSDTKAECLKYYRNQTRQNETMDKLRQMVLSYPRERAMSFGKIRFLAGVREELIQRAAEALQQADSMDQVWANRLAAQKLDADNKLRSLTAENGALKEQISRGKEYQARLEREKEALRQGNQREAEQLAALCLEKDEEITYLRRCLDRPTAHSGVAAWVERHFQEKLILLPGAVSELSSQKARAVDLRVICDALDFLATDYRDKRYQVITEDEMYSRCSQKYNRPFEVMPTGTMSVSAYYQEYHVPYDAPTKRSNGDRELDYHLGWGNSSDGLLRIYFFHDDKKKLIVVGSLPLHLPIMIR